VEQKEECTPLFLRENLQIGFLKVMTTQSRRWRPQLLEVDSQTLPNQWNEAKNARHFSSSNVPLQILDEEIRFLKSSNNSSRHKRTPPHPPSHSAVFVSNFQVIWLLRRHHGRCDAAEILPGPASTFFSEVKQWSKSVLRTDDPRA
jgi:hypothetical protein